MIMLDIQRHISGKEGVKEATWTNKTPPSFAGHQTKLKIETQRGLTSTANIMGYQAPIMGDSAKTPL